MENRNTFSELPNSDSTTFEIQTRFKIQTIDISKYKYEHKLNIIDHHQDNFYPYIGGTFCFL